jgi:predicted PurR-regulated permease PerM
MNKTLKTILIIIGVSMLLLSLWYFSDLVIYVLISIVLSIIGAPIVKLLRKIEIGKFKLPGWFCALLTLGIFIVFFISLITMFGPLVADEAAAFSKINVEETARSIEGSLAKTEEWLNQFNISGDDRSNREYIIEQLKEAINFSKIGNAFSNIFGLLGNAFIAVFSVLFISFFFLKDASLFQRIIYSATPDKYLEKVQNIMRNASRLLTRYFFALLAQVTIFTIVISTGLGLIGIENAILIGFLAGLINLIPYVGPIIGGLIGIVIALSTNQSPELAGIWIIVIKVASIFLIAQLIDNLIVQPFIFANSVNAHPLEIFFVISIAGSIAGIPGMVLAIPGYTFLRIIAKEFLSEFKFVESLTRNL